ncbi:MAG: hypothetical protein QXF82_10745 [Nitrososphaeria archaeon]
MTQEQKKLFPYSIKIDYGLELREIIHLLRLAKYQLLDRKGNRDITFSVEGPLASTEKLGVLLLFNECPEETEDGDVTIPSTVYEVVLFIKDKDKVLEELENLTKIVEEEVFLCYKHHDESTDYNACSFLAIQKRLAERGVALF